MDKETKTITIKCDRYTEENGYDYKCPRLDSDDWDELVVPCVDCIHFCHKEITINP